MTQGLEYTKRALAVCSGAPVHSNYDMICGEKRALWHFVQWKGTLDGTVSGFIYHRGTKRALLQCFSNKGGRGANMFLRAQF